MIPNIRMRQDDSGASPEVEAIATEVIGAAIEVHRVLGPGFPESVYRNALSYELKLRNISHSCEAIVPVLYKGQSVGEGRVDILIAAGVIIELKTVEYLVEAHRAQVITYLQAMKLKLGLLSNFNVSVLKDGIRRVLNPHVG